MKLVFDKDEFEQICEANARDIPGYDNTRGCFLVEFQY